MRTINAGEDEPGGEDNIPDIAMMRRLVETVDRGLRVMAAAPFVSATMAKACMEYPGRPNLN